MASHKIQPPRYDTLSESNEQNPYGFIPDDFKFSTSVGSCELQIRQWFIRKVYTLLGIQLFISFGLCVIINYYATLYSFVLENTWLLVVSVIGSFATCLWLSLSPRREDRDNSQETIPWYCLSYRGQLVLLFLFTLMEGYSISALTLMYDSKVIMRALLITCIVILGITLIALSGKFEMAMESYLNIYYWLNLLVWLMIGIGISSFFFGMGSKIDLIYSWLGATIFSIYLFVDTQLIMRKVYPDEEIRCAMTLYLDIINLFLYILRIMARQEDD